MKTEDGRGVDILGPVDCIAVEFPGGVITGVGFRLVMKMVRAGAIRVLDLEFIAKDADGSLSRVALKDVVHGGDTDITVWDGAASGLLDEDDFAQVGAAIAPEVWLESWSMRTPGQCHCSRHWTKAPPGSSVGNASPLTTFWPRWVSQRRQRLETESGGGIANGPIEDRFESRRRGEDGRRHPSADPRSASRPVGTVWAAPTRCSWSAPCGGRSPARRGWGTGYAAPAAGPPPGPSGVIDQLERLGQLRASGVLTDAEFEAQKYRVLAG